MQIRRDAFRSVPQLKAAIQDFIEAHQANPKPFVWTKSADEILASIARFAQRTADARAAQQMSRTTVTGQARRQLSMTELKAKAKRTPIWVYRNGGTPPSGPKTVG